MLNERYIKTKQRSMGQNRNDMKEQNSETNPQEGTYHKHILY